MKHPHFRRSIVVIAAVFATCPVYGQDQGASRQFCALRFNISLATGRAVRSTWVELLDSEGNTVFRKMVLGSSGEICDFGFGPHKLRVGTNECYPTQIENVRLKLGTPIELSVVLNKCTSADVRVDGGEAYVRVTDESGRGIAAVSIHAVKTGQEVKADDYGRAQITCSGDEQLTVRKTGYKDKTVEVRCSRTSDTEISVALERQSRQ